jgi:chromosome segregation ATPase
MSEPVLEPQNGTDGTPQEISGTIFERLVGINEAITICRVSKSQISRDSNSKRLAYILGDKGQKRYKVADLYNLYGFRKQDEKGSEELTEPVSKTTGTADFTTEIAVLKAELRAKEAALQAKDETLHRIENEVQDLRQTRDRLLDQNNRLTMLLPAPPSTVPEPTSNQVTIKKSFWQRLFS